MQIRKATKKDIPTMREIFNYGREVQLQTGNLNQWNMGYPTDEVILEDIQQRAAHICTDDEGNIIGVFSVFTDPDPTYKNIDGAWLNEKPYATIHRIATNGQVKGTGQYCIEWVQNQYDDVRIDTHEDNEQMKHIVRKLGFEYCGVISLENGDPRNAYHYTKNNGN